MSFTTVAALFALIATSGSSLAQCVAFQESPPVFLRSEHEARILATVVEGRPPDPFWPPHSVAPGPWNPRGQLVVVEEADGPGTDRIGPDSIVAIFRWGRDRSEIYGCRPTPARDSLAVGGRHIFSAILRADSLWVAGRPTFDVSPHVLAEYPGAMPRTPSTIPPVEDYREFLAMLPSRDEWNRDCRPAVIRVQGWLDSHQNGRGMRFPFSNISMRLRPACDYSLERHAAELERWKPSRPIPDTLRDLLRNHGCRDDADLLNDWDDAVDGHFIQSDSQQWVVICSTPSYWSLLVVLPEPSVGIVELARLRGNAWSWTAGAAPPEYFDWSSSREIGSGRWSVPAPRRDVVLLKFLSGAEDQTLAFYETEAGWVHVGVRCCRWPD